MEKSNFQNSEWWYSTFVQCAREFLAVLFQLIAYSRLGNFDFFNGSLVLFVTLVVFNFPFLNSYLFSVMRFGPWCTQTMSMWDIVGLILQTVLVTVSQVVGALLAAVFTYAFETNWPDLKVVNEKSNGTVAGVSYSDIDSKLDGSNDRVYILLEEYFAVLTLLIGLIHLVHSDLPGILKTAYGSDDPPKQDEVQKKKPNPIPIELIFHAAILVAGVTRAFPSAHQSLHISVYLGARNISSMTTVGMRVVGGLLAACTSIMYYNFMYVWVGSTDHNIMHNRLIDPKSSALFYSELTLPDSMGNVKRSI